MINKMIFAILIFFLTAAYCLYGENINIRNAKDDGFNGTVKKVTKETVNYVKEDTTKKTRIIELGKIFRKLHSVRPRYNIG